MTKIIGHRGGLGLFHQNTLSSIKAAMALGCDAIEIDIRRTRDGQLVLMHDRTTWRVARKNVSLHETSSEELRTIQLKNGEHIPSLEEVFMLVGNKVPLMLDIKDDGVAQEMLHLLDLFPQVQVCFSGRQYDDLKQMHEARPELPFLLQHHYDPIEIIHHAHSMGATGICLNMWLMNPWTYRLAKQHQLDVYVYTINHRWLLRFFQMFYPDAVIISNHPERLLSSRSAAAKDSSSTTLTQ
jgi:glycerophosphoryl diester phosphodiesterase